MSLNYNKSKNAHNSDSFWTSYSDLFLGLSTIFLLLYVTASLRTGTDAIKSMVENQKLTMQVEELKSQIKMYEQVKSDYLKSQASDGELQEYKELMDKLTLLQSDAKNEKEKLVRQALENEQKAQALNKYQQMVRNIINANKVAKTKLVARNDIIGEQDTTIDIQQQSIESLQSDVQVASEKIKESENEIAQAKTELEKNKKKLRNAYKENRMTKKQYDRKVKELQESSDTKISALEAQNKSYNSKLNQVSAALAQKSQEAQSAKNEAQDLKGQIGQLQSQFDAERAKDRAAFEKELNKGKLDAAEKAKKEAEFRANMDRKEKELQGKIAGLSGKLKSVEGELAKAQEERDARRNIAAEIKKGFKAAGVKAEVDEQTGEVVLDFGDAYFENDSSKLKDKMKSVIDKAMPTYSKSLFENKKVADKISSVEIIGFASPTYGGKFIDPASPNASDKAAIKYNMDLSYRRAKSIFTYILEDKANEFEHHNELMGLMKVSGRSFLDVMKVQKRSPASAAEFCKVNDCKKAQRVIIRFSMDGKK